MNQSIVQGEINIVWFRRDLRLEDHAALYHAVLDAEENGRKVLPLFIFDKKILHKLKNSNDRRMTFLIESVIDLDHKFKNNHSSILVKFGNPIEVFKEILQSYKVVNVFCNRDYEPYAKRRDTDVAAVLKSHQISFHQYKDHVIFEKHEVLTQKKEIYKVFTPYKNEWLKVFQQKFESELPVYNLKPALLSKSLLLWTSKEQDYFQLTGFEAVSDNRLKGGRDHALNQLNKFENYIEDYDELRNLPFKDQTSNISPYIRFGLVSIRELVKFAQAQQRKLNHKKAGPEIWLSELVWRDFYQMILDVYPKLEKSSFKDHCDQIQWPGNLEHFELWKNGQTGFPIVDSAMRCFKETGMMNNRLRMIVASFLCKTLLLNWRFGEEYFAEMLLDFDMAANNGGWQWSASTGVDAQPYFRIFNPTAQSEKFDPDGEFIKQWCPELRLYDKKHIHEPYITKIEIQRAAKCLIGKDYPKPIVDYKKNRELALMMYKAVSY